MTEESTKCGSSTTTVSLNEQGQSGGAITLEMLDMLMAYAFWYVRGRKRPLCKTKSAKTDWVLVALASSSAP